MANPDLASVLSTLSALSNTPTSTPTPVQPEAGISHEDDYEPPEIPPTPSALAPTPVPAPSAAPAQPPHTPNTNTDPTTITTWPPALRHIMQTISDQSKSQSQSQSQSPSQQLQTRVRRLLHSQHEHERQWWEGRQALCRKLGDRVERGREVDEVLYVMFSCYFLVSSCVLWWWYLFSFLLEIWSANAHKCGRRAVGAPVSSHNTGISVRFTSCGLPHIHIHPLGQHTLSAIIHDQTRPDQTRPDQTRLD